MRKTLGAAAAAVLVTVLAAAGCGSAVSPTAASTTTGKPAQPATGAKTGTTAHPTPPATSAPATSAPPATPNVNVTKTQADAILSAIETANNKANTARDDKQLAAYEEQSAYKIDSVGYELLIFQDPKNSHPSKPFTYDNRQYVIPKLTSYPRWFVAETTYKDPSGNQVPNILLISQSADGAPWKIDYEPVIWAGTQAAGAKAAGVKAAGVKLPAFALDADGYATAVTATDYATLALQPDRLGDTVAAAERGGAGSTAAAQFATYNGLDQEAKNLATTRANMSPGQVSLEALPAPGYPVFALRTADGGALVFTTHAMRWAFVVGSSFFSKYQWINLNGGLGALYSGRGKAYRSVNEDFLSEDMVYVPAAGSHDKPSVLGTTGTYYDISSR